MISGLMRKSGERRLLGLARVDDDDALGHGDLDRREADAGRLVHGLQHVVEQTPHLRVDTVDRFGNLSQQRIRKRDDGQNGHCVFAVALCVFMR